MNLKIMSMGTLAVALTTGFMTPVLGDNGASTRNVIISGAAAALGITNYYRKRHIKQEELQEQNRRLQAYREWFHKKFRRDPTKQEAAFWYLNAYGVQPS
jgi:hypothetical protein